MASQIEPLENELKDLEKKLDTKENEWKSLKQQIEKAENLLKIIDEESKIRSGNISSTKKLSKMETLQNQINQQEKQAAILKEVV